MESTILGLMDTSNQRAGQQCVVGLVVYTGWFTVAYDKATAQKEPLSHISEVYTSSLPFKRLHL